MRPVISALAGVLVIAACASAQKPSTAGQMDILSAQDMLEDCLMRSEGQPRSDAAACNGRYAQACMRFRPDGETTVGMVRCVIEETEAWDNQLNAGYQVLMARYEGQSAYEELRSAQRAWITFRDADCTAAMAAWEGGSIAQIMHAQCMLDHTANRTLDLRGRIADMPG